MKSQITNQGSVKRLSSTLLVNKMYSTGKLSMLILSSPEKVGAPCIDVIGVFCDVIGCEILGFSFRLRNLWRDKGFRF